MVSNSERIALLVQLSDESEKLLEASDLYTKHSEKLKAMSVGSITSLPLDDLKQEISRLKSIQEEAVRLADLMEQSVELRKDVVKEGNDIEDSAFQKVEQA